MSCAADSIHRDGILVHGVGICDYAGFEEGEFSDMASLGEAVLNAIEQAEQQSCQRIREVALAVPAPFVKLLTTRATLRIASRSGRVSVQDVDDVISMSLEKARAPGYVLMHSTPVYFTVGGVESAAVRRARGRTSSAPRSRTCMCRRASCSRWSASWAR